jgi:hypothetical protein
MMLLAAAARMLRCWQLGRFLPHAPDTGTPSPGVASALRALSGPRGMPCITVTYDQGPLSNRWAVLSRHVMCDTTATVMTDVCSSSPQS